MATEEPLLNGTDSESKNGGGEEESLVWGEVKKQLYLAGPLVAGYLLLYVIQLISLMFVGHLGELELAGASVATSFATVTGFSLLGGMATSLETLCGQAFGAKQHHLLGVYKQRAMLVLVLVSVPVAAMWTYTSEILAWFGQDPEIAAAAATYIRGLIPALLVNGPLNCHMKFLQTQNVVVPVMLGSGVTALTHLPVCWVLVRALGLGSAGAALGIAVSYTTNLGFLALYVRLSPRCRSTWTGFSREAFRGIPAFFRLAVPSAMMVCIEWWSFEFLVLLSGLLPNPKLETAVLSICINTITLAFMVPLGLGGATSTRVSNELGAGRPQAARLAAWVVVLLSLLVAAFGGLVMVLVRNLWGYLYSNDERVIKYIARMLPILAISFLFDCIMGVLSGVIRGCGRQKIGASINLASYYLVGIPLGYFFAFVCHVGGMGLWFGLLSAMVVETILLICITLCTNWDKEVLKAKDTVHSSACLGDMTT
ncbi:Protein DETOXIFICATION 16 [Dichanthelium oligosanthes]|uniref:Protein DETOXIFICATION n=1 Tax=Dichanthelium oligosanthes TaxID=888268 RepID=A0A1E5VL64_9POAL|nr:Protein DETOXIFICATION 16 [Dichanthelium oligosanthes]